MVRISNLELGLMLNFPPHFVLQLIWLALVKGLEGQAYPAMCIAYYFLVLSLLVIFTIGNVDVNSISSDAIALYLFIKLLQ